MAREGIIRCGEITLEDDDKVYTARFDFLRGGWCGFRPGSRPTSVVSGRKSLRVDCSGRPLIWVWLSTWEGQKA